jgi:hypothetical protein
MKFINPLNILPILESHKDWMEWEPETIWHEMENHLDTTSIIPRTVKDIVMSVKLCLLNNMTWEKWNVFEKVVMAFNNETPIFEVVQKPSLGQISLTIEILNKIKPNIFADEVKLYIAAVAHNDGYIVIPDNLKFAQEELNRYSKDIADKREAINLAWKLFKIKGESIPKDDDNFVTIQCTRMLAIDKYVKQQLA